MGQVDREQEAEGSGRTTGREFLLQQVIYWSVVSVVITTLLKNLSYQSQMLTLLWEASVQSIEV
jgi:hypothetical protein